MYISMIIMKYNTVSSKILSWITIRSKSHITASISKGTISLPTCMYDPIIGLLVCSVKV
jgi:hypothetical protein